MKKECRSDCPIYKISSQILEGEYPEESLRCEPCDQTVYAEVHSENKNGSTFYLRIVNGQIGTPNKCKFQNLTGLQLIVDSQSLRSSRVLKR